MAGRVDGHLATFTEHMREGLLTASTAIGLAVLADVGTGTGFTPLIAPAVADAPDDEIGSGCGACLLSAEQAHGTSPTMTNDEVAWS